MSFSMIAAVGQNNELGKGGGLIWRLPEDLKFFKKVTMGFPIFMGLRTWESLPGKLPGREHFVLATSSENVTGDVNVVTDLEDFIERWKGDERRVFVIGGGSVYRQMLPYADEIYLTEVEATDEGADTFFPVFDRREFNVDVLGEGEYGEIKYRHVLYKKK